MKDCEDGIFLFGKKTCPNCKVAETLLNKSEIFYKKIDAEEEVLMAQEFGIKSAPTLIVIENGKIKKIGNVSNIKKYVETRK